MEPLTDTQREILDFETAWAHWKYAAAKDGELLHRFGMKPTTYYAVLNELLDNPAGLAHAPQTVNRLRRLREARQAQRSSARAAQEPS